MLGAFSTAVFAIDTLTSFYGGVLCRNGTSSGWLGLDADCWPSTSAVSSITYAQGPLDMLFRKRGLRSIDELVRTRNE